MSLQITKLIDTSSKTYNHETQFTEIMSKVSAYKIRLDKLSTANMNKIDIAMKEYEEILNTKVDKKLMVSKLSHLSPSIRHSLLQIHTTLILLPTNLQLISLNVHFSSHHIFNNMLHILPNNYHPLPYKARPFLNLKKWWDVIWSNFYQYLSTKKSWTTYKNLA